MDNAAIGRMAARHFLDRGYRNFAFFHHWDLGVSRRRRDSFETKLARYGHHCEVLSWHKGWGKRPDTRDQRHRWLIHNLTALPKPLALFATRDIEAVEVIEACLSSGLSVPE
jgi:LacI family transcriptional regulator